MYLTPCERNSWSSLPLLLSVKWFSVLPSAHTHARSPACACACVWAVFVGLYEMCDNLLGDMETQKHVSLREPICPFLNANLYMLLGRWLIVSSRSFFENRCCLYKRSHLKIPENIPQSSWNLKKKYMKMLNGFNDQIDFLLLEWVFFF